MLIKQALLAKRQSKSNLVKVGCSIQDKLGNVYTGFNGDGFMGGPLEDETGKTSPGVIHAEADAIAHSRTDLTGATIVVTLAPCMNCAALIANSGIKHVYYIDRWWDIGAIELLLIHGVQVTKLKRKSKADTNHHDTSPLSS